MSTDKKKETKEIENLEENKEREFYTRSDNTIVFDGVFYSDHGSSNEVIANLVFNLLEARNEQKLKEEEEVKLEDLIKKRGKRIKDDNHKKEELSAQIVSNSKNLK